MSILDIPLEVWHWFGDEAFSRKLRQCCVALVAVRGQERTCWSALGLFSTTRGNYSESTMGGNIMLWYRGQVVCEGHEELDSGVEYEPGRSVTYRPGVTRVWTAPAADLAYYLAALRIDAEYGTPLDLEYTDGVVSKIGGVTAVPGRLNRRMYVIGAKLYSTARM
jgi:hypothetical protein